MACLQAPVREAAANHPDDYGFADCAITNGTKETARDAKRLRRADINQRVGKLQCLLRSESDLMPRAAELRDGQQQTLCASVSTKNPGAFWPGFVWIRKLINQAGSTEVSASCANQTCQARRGRPRRAEARLEPAFRREELRDGPLQIQKRFRRRRSCRVRRLSRQCRQAYAHQSSRRRALSR
jgi:hypothetical protein